MKFLLIILFCLTVSACAIISKDKKTGSEPGLIITNFSDDSNLKEAGAEINDILLKYDGELLYSVSQLDELKNAVNTDEIEVVVKRGDALNTYVIPKGKIGVYLLPIIKQVEFAGDAVMIDNVERVGWDLDMDVSFFGCLSSIEKLKGSGCSYNDLMVLSGYGMRTCFHDKICPSSPDATVGYDTGSLILKKLGYDFEFVFLKGMENEANHPELNYLSKKDFNKKICNSIDRGWPVMAVNLIRVPEWGIVTGYQNNKSQLLCRTFFDQSDSYQIAHNFPFVAVIIKDKKDINVSDLYSSYFENVDDIFNIKTFESYNNGLYAYDRWIYRLQQEDSLVVMEDKKFYDNGFANTWIYYCLADSRRKQCEYLKDHRNDFVIPSASIDNLIKLYGNEADILSAGLYDVAPMEGNITREIWTTDMRKRQIATLKEVRRLENKIYDTVKYYSHKNSIFDKK